MKFRSFVATYSPQADKQITNKHNYFMNGIIKDDISLEGCIEICENSLMRNLYALADGSKSVAHGEDAAYMCMDMMREINGSDFDKENADYLNMANDLTKGRAFEQGGAALCVSLAALYIYNRTAVAYNVGEVSVFHIRKDSIKKISGEMPKTVEVEEIVKEDNKLTVADVTKETAPYIGYLSDEHQVVPGVSERIRVKVNDYFVIATQSVIDTVSPDEILAVLRNKAVPAEEKARMILDIACEENPDENYSVEVIQSKRRSVIRGIKNFLAVVATILILTLAGVYSFPYITAAGKAVSDAVTGFFVNTLFGSDSTPDEVVTDQWTPIPDEKQGETDKDKADEGEGDAEDVTEADPVEETPVPQTAPVQARPQSRPKTTTVSPKPSTTTTAPQTSSKTDTDEQKSTQNTPDKAEEETVEKPVTPPAVENRDAELPIDFN